uniref:hypothetical protein n=1 Tax=uncultured Draconibacterium sp. TaxID=1573823 RepID=UPI00321641D9
METIYYLPIKSTSLVHYFGKACIVPSKYLTNKPIDIQNKIGGSLILTNKIAITDSDCSLELVFTESEKKELINTTNGVFLYSKPLPISRVKSVIFFNQDIKEQTIASLELSSAFIPNYLIKVEVGHKKEDLLIPKNDKTEIKIDWSEQIEKFDRLLGGMALMRFGGEDYMNYSENYFSTLSFFNTVIKTEVEISGRQIKKLYHDAFIGADSFKSLYKFLNKPITDNDVIEIAKSEGQLIKRNNITRIIDLSMLDKATYIVAVLNTYGVSSEARKKKVDGLILSNFKSDLKQDKAEVLSLCYGLNRGYSAFNNKYRSGNIVKDVKFKLDSQLDYYTIESLYQFAFNKTTSGEFSYLDKWCKIRHDTQIFSKNEFMILDVKVIGKKKPKVGSKEYLEELMKTVTEKIKNVLFGTHTISDVISELVFNVSNDKEDELQEKFIEQNEIITKNVQLQLSKVDKILFDRIDKNGDGILDSEEIAEFLKELKLSKSSIKVLPKSNDLQKSNDAQKETVNSDFDLIIDKVLKLKKMTATEFKKVAKYHDVKIDKGYKDKDDRDEIIKRILKKSTFEIPFN